MQAFSPHAVAPRQKAKNPSDYERLLTVITCLTRQIKHQSKQHLEDGQISHKLQQGSRDLDKAADKQKCAANLMQGR